MKVSGTFEVNLAPLAANTEALHGQTLGRMSIDKTFVGPLDARSHGEMLTAVTTVRGSAGYVAIEQVSGNLDGKKGSFVLQHFGIIHEGNTRLELEVVPDSGTGELSGLRGTMTIDINDGQHHYTFDYEWAE